MILSIIINTVIFIATAIILLHNFWKDGKWNTKRGLKAFRYFTILSNAFCAVSALGMVIAQAGGTVSQGVLLLKYLGTVSVTVTLLTVLFFLGPTQGFKIMLSGSNLYLHLIGPVLAILSYGFLEKKPITIGTAMIGLLPMIVYGVVYLYKVIIAAEDKRWEDFYGFNRGGKWPVAFAMMTAGTLAVCVVLWLI